ncbi:MAG: type IV pili methyl-accepting chemotaxis transducer N-terminal domain-containing protein, partial [Myxococcota bacterium]
MALIAIAAFAGLAWVTQQWLLSAQKDNATLINVSGRQRMLSQQVALAAVQAAVQDDPAARDAAQEKMRRGVEQLKTSHQAILYGSDELGLTAQISDAARQYYVETLNPQFDEYIELSDSLVAEPAVSGDARLQLLQKRSETVLVRLNHAVMLHQAAAEADVAHLQTAELLILLATLMTLLLEALLVYLPLLRQLGQTFAALDQNKALQRALEAARQARRQLDEALDAIPVGFAAWTQTGELQICNERYQEMHPQLAPLLEPGVRYVDILNHADQLGVPSPDT